MFFSEVNHKYFLIGHVIPLEVMHNITSRQCYTAEFHYHSDMI